MLTLYVCIYIRLQQQISVAHIWNHILTINFNHLSYRSQRGA
jgi:hypothetical protein